MDSGPHSLISKSSQSDSKEEAKNIDKINTVFQNVEGIDEIKQVQIDTIIDQPIDQQEDKLKPDSSINLNGVFSGVKTATKEHGDDSSVFVPH